MNVADFILKYLSDRGVREAFAITGGHAMFLNDALARNKQLRYTCPLHEQSVTMAAEAYGRAKGLPAIAMVTAGPGAANALTGVVGAWVDSSPMVVISGQSNLAIVRYAEKTNIRQFGVQGISIKRMMTPITKYFVTVDNPKKIGTYMANAWNEVTTGRPGPVWLEVPLDIQRAEVPANIVATAAYSPAATRPAKVPPALAKKVAEVYKRIAKAKRPLFIFGQGVRLSGGVPAFEALIKKIKIPLLTSRLGLDIIPSDHPLYIGRPGTYGERAANLAVQNADLIIAVGSRLTVSLTGYNVKDFGRNAEIILVDIDEKELRKPDLRVTMPVKADAKVFLEALAAQAEEYGGIERGRWLAIAKQWRKKYPVVLPEYKNEKPVNSYYLVDRLSALAPEGAYILTDTSSCFHVGAQAWNVKRGQRYMTTGGISTMGYWVASIGMCIANNRKSTIVLVGDGSLQMNIQDLATVKGDNLPLKIFIFNNNGYLLMRHTQRNFFEGRMIGESPSSGVSLPDSLKIAEAYGIKAIRIHSVNEVDAKIKEALAYDGPIICDVLTPEWQAIIPRIGGTKQPDGSITPNAYENMSPPLPPEELKNNMNPSRT
ncbi:MAG: thiamine pyrophosphate-binding protein [Candidatus Harrisonbacteria bacterium]|nr:thiamine pyrophosphate-binding protein [Candidatus Harrisonbacteria bacterium]